MLSLFRRRVARSRLLFVLTYWVLLAVPGLFAFPSAIPASRVQEVFGLELGDQVTQPTGHTGFLWMGPGQNSIPDLRETWHAPRVPFVSRVFRVDVDLDGDFDLIALKGLSRVLVWINDGRGHYFLVSPGSCNLVKARPFFLESAENDFLPLWLEPQKPCLDYVSLGSIAQERMVMIPRCEKYSPRSPRAPPVSPFIV
jgi:hypothetical protein